MIYLLIKVCVNKGLIRIKTIFRTLKISYHNGKVGVYLRGGIGFKSCPMHVINILIYYLFIYMYLKTDILFYGFHVVCGIHYDTVLGRHHDQRQSIVSKCDIQTLRLV